MPQIPFKGICIRGVVWAYPYAAQATNRRCPMSSNSREAVGQLMSILGGIRTVRKTLLASIIAVACSNAYAIDSFTPLDAPATAGNTDQALAPFVLPSGWTQKFITDRDTLTARGMPATFGNWDMVAIAGASSKHVYIPMEVSQGAGVIRYNRDTDDFVTILEGNNTGIFASDPGNWNPLNDDYGALDPAEVTPFGTVLTAEEWSGNGRIFEIKHAATASFTAEAGAQWLSNVPSVSHEGLKFDSSGRLYFVDENSSGSLYRLTPNAVGDLSSGKVEVLKVDAFTGNAAEGASDVPGGTGSATWVEMVDAAGNATTVADPFDFTNRGGRAAADELGGTPYGRPEDLEVGTLSNGNEVILMATTSENIVYSIELDADGSGNPFVRELLNSDVTPDNIGNDPVGSGADDATYGLDDPDNLAIDIGPNGELQVFIIEDENPGDIWMATDADGDGVAESVDLFASLGPFGSEPTGFIADPRGGFLVAIQHPADGNDALWSIAPAPVPVPAAVWLFGSALAGLAGASKSKRRA